ncbi:MAG: metabolite traffic protein EboE [Planctomycetota bacterium]
MRDALGEGTVLGYCTNVHPGRTLDEIKAQLDEHAAGVRERVCPKDELGVGLWFPASVAWRLAADDKLLDSFKLWLEQRRLFCFGLNGFPYGDFHADVVKHAVYEPDWSSERRAEYTRDLVKILARLAPDDVEPLTVTTLPLGWDGAGSDAESLHRVTTNALSARSERDVVLCVEPEPGCTLSRAAHVAEYAWRLGEELPLGLGTAGVCHDVCHAAVLKLDQRSELKTYRDRKVSVERVQISSCPVSPRGPEELGRFIEPRYLHQTTVGDAFFADLPEALSSGLTGESRTHFHVPVHLGSIGDLATTQNEIAPAVRTARHHHRTRVFEVETYAWGVLPDNLQPAALADGIARELEWCLENLTKGLADTNSDPLFGGDA